MKKIILLIVANLFTFSVLAEPENLNVRKLSLIKYHDSGAYERDLQTVANRAEKYLAQRIAQNERAKAPKKLAVVLDIDDTALSNYQHLVDLNFGGTREDRIRMWTAANDPVISGTLQLYQEAKNHNVAVFFITGRPAAILRPATTKNLMAAGYHNWDGLFLKPQNYTNPSVIPYKSGVRKDIETKGYDIVVNMGDQYSDLKGGYADATFKLPNPYYYLP